MASHKFTGHVVLFNFAGISKIQRVLDELSGDDRIPKSVPKVLIDDELTELPSALQRRNVHFVRGNPTLDETLERANLDHAKYAVVMTKPGAGAHSDNQNVAIALAIEGRAPGVHTVVECNEFSTHELLKKAGCDAVVCTSRFDAHFLSHELLNPGVQEVVDQLTSNLKGQQICLTPATGDGDFGEYAKRCTEQEHLAIGLQREGRSEFNLDAGSRVRHGDFLISIGRRRLKAL